MVWHVIRKETRELFRSGRFRFGIVVVLMLLMLAVVISTSYFNQIQEQHATANQNERMLWLDQGNANPHNAAHYGTYAFKPKYPLSLLDPGVDKFTGISVYLEAHARNEAEHVAAADQTGLARFGDITPDFILLFIIPLFIVLIGHDNWTKEKQRGTLRLVKSQGVSTWRLALGKWLSLYMPVSGFTVLLFLIAGLVLSNLNQFGVFSWSALLLMLVVYLIYFAIFNTITLLISVLSKNSDMSLVLLLAFWILSCLAMPKAASNYSDTRYPYPTRQEFQAAVAVDKQKGVDGHDPWSKASLELQEETLKAYNVSELKDLPFNFDALRMQKGEEHEARVYFKHYENLRNIHETQSKIYKSTALLSPFLPARFLSMAIAQTDYYTHWEFTDAAENHRIQMQKVLNTDFAENSRLGEWDYQADTTLWSKIPVFDFEPESARAVMVRENSYLAILLAWLVVSFSGLYLSVRKS